MTRRMTGVLIVAVLAAAALLPLHTPSLAVLVTLIFAKAIVVLGIIVLLQAGQVSFGHAMYFAAGAYTAAFWGRFIGIADITLYLLLGSIAAGLLGPGGRIVRRPLPRDLLWHAQPCVFHGALVAAGENVPLHQWRRRHPHPAPDPVRYCHHAGGVRIRSSLSHAGPGGRRRLVRAALSRQPTRPHAAGHALQRDAA